ncbi:PAS domain-containing sensor histidine kinase [Mucilaginibacter lappiensis]|uniref:Sensor protein FixL n=1 Tax=Mucilaginibacter lappiensis TaxID=354630 RepID=A0A1N7GEU5_9SPHI|nr:PAS domain-containing sensor histidine kinase [Mucilaginibacter lappiensis]MBB6113040.1 PAS domain S-box-containing protein [Mucilaginibacter lappiensis]MBB6130694.1 PAS domain S-box-containing protein [Mucilaginibacter lappiensis]SIS11058.1 PAS/PAC sensor signal transduction histidine kinase [Mucilaginibacter lappiensis]
MENTALLIAIIQNAIDGIITIDENGIIELINPAACTLFDYQSDEVIGNNISMLMPQPDKDAHDDYIFRHRQTGKASIIGIGREVVGLRKDGSIFPFRLALSEVQFAGRKIYTGFIHDLSKEKEAERRLKEYASHLEELVEERTMSLKETVKALENAKEDLSLSLEKEKELGQLKSRFVSMASHEFRTPLTSVKLSASLIEKYAQPLASPNVSKHVNKIKQAVSSLTVILNDFLSLEKLEAGKEEVSYNDFDLVKFSEEIAEEMQVMAKQNQNIIYQHTGTKSTVNLDEKLLKNCINNLITNAIKYSGENTFIDFTTEINQHHCIITVKDNGIGIPEADQKHLFEAFFRAHNTGTIPGTGLGLNIVTRYAGLMNGIVDFKSVINQGTLFTISFPLS